ncbi:MAG: hypothetical protein K6T83_01190 [Alicyclobacillus sp.]|nr:hypothetical protein [Alicyclobacillus sp.]
MSQVVVPITPGQNQTVTCTLPVDGGNVTLTFDFTWNGQGGYWFATITDDAGNILLDGIPIITGQYPAANILRQYQHLGIGSAYVVPAATSGLADNADYSNLGSDFLLIWSDSESYIGG